MRWFPILLLLSACDPHDGDDDTDVPDTDVDSEIDSDTELDSDAEVTYTDLDPDVAPVTDGDWVETTSLTTWSRNVSDRLTDVIVADLSALNPSDIQAIHDADQWVFCRFSAGRIPVDDVATSPLPEHVIDANGWLDVRSDDVQTWANTLLADAASLDCDGVVIDDIDGVYAGSSFGNSTDNQLGFSRYVFNQAHRQSLAVAFDADVALIEPMAAYGDAALTIDYVTADSGDDYSAFIERDLPLWNLETDVTDPQDRCRDALIAGTRTLTTGGGIDTSCDTAFPSTTRLAHVDHYTTYYGRNTEDLADLGVLDLAIVQPLLTPDQLSDLQFRTQVAVYLSIGEIGLSNTYLLNGEEVLGQVIYDANPEWFLGENPFFDSWFANTNDTGWQDFVLGQAELLMDQGYDGIFMDTVDTVDVYPDTIPGMVTLISRLRSQHPDAIIVQNRGMNVIPQSGPDVDALMFEVFSTRYDFTTSSYAQTDVTAPGYAQIVEKAVDYRLTGGVVLAQDFGAPGGEWDDLICYASQRAQTHLFMPSYADELFQDGLFDYPSACPWPAQSTPGVSVDSGLIHLRPDQGTTVDFDVEPGVTLSLVNVPRGLEADLIGNALTVSAEPAALGGTLVIELTDGAVDYRLAVDVHEETVYVTNAGLSDVIVFDEPANATAQPDRRTSATLAQPYAIAVDADGTTWVAENVGAPTAAQPAGAILGYSAFDLSEPIYEVTSGLSYPTGLATSDDGTIWVANSALDWTGTPRSTPNIATFTPGDTTATVAINVDFLAHGYPRSLAFDDAGNLWMTTTYGLIVGYDVQATPTVFAVMVLDLPNYTVKDLLFDGGDLWFTGTTESNGLVMRINAGGWSTDGQVTNVFTAPLRQFTTGLYAPWGIDIASNGDLWVVNSTDALDTSDSRGSLIRMDPVTGAIVTDIALESRFTLGVAVD